MTVVNYELIEQTAVIRVNNPPVNALSHTLRQGIVDAIGEAQKDNSRAIILICEGRTFFAGADITEFGKPQESPSLADLLSILEDSSKPVIAAIHGSALGGGLEVALACHYRCALHSAKVGLPEVRLGLLPGAGGTQRTPRLAGVEAALELISSGNPIDAKHAQGLNLIDKVIDGDLFGGVLAYAKSIIKDNAKPVRASDINIDPSTAPRELFDNFRQRLVTRARGQHAPQHIVTCVEAAVRLPFDEGLAKERELFLECMASSQSVAMRHLFFAERAAAKIEDVPKDTTLRRVNSVAIIGGGTMGGGIAMNFANVGIPVKLLEINDEALARGLAIIEKNYTITVRKGKLSEQQKKQCLSLIKGTTDYDDLADVDLVIEAVFESVDLKKKIFRKLDSVCKPGAILGTNTSYQDIDAIANATQRPQDVIGLHFFSPANVMKLLEVVRGEKTADDVIATSMRLAKDIRKIPVLARNCYGFIGNRILRTYYREAQFCLLRGSSPQQIDGIMEDWGMAMGPFTVGDLAGLDVGYKARQGLSDEQKGNPKSFCIPDALVELGRLGQKSGAGYYSYDPETRARINDPAVMEVVEAQAKVHGVTRNPIEDNEILNRLTFSLINEAAKVLEEGIAQRPGDIDIVYAFGYGYPNFRGGPMHYADTVGLKTICTALSKYYEECGEEHLAPAPLLKNLAESGQTFSEWSNNR